MRQKKSNENRRMWATPQFKRCLYEQKALNPDKTLFEIQNEIARAVREQSIKVGGKKDNAPFWGKI